MQILLANAKMMLCPTEVAAKPLTLPAWPASVLTSWQRSWGAAGSWL